MPRKTCAPTEHQFEARYDERIEVPKGLQYNIFDADKVITACKVNRYLGDVCAKCGIHTDDLASED